MRPVIIVTTDESGPRLEEHFRSCLRPGQIVRFVHLSSSSPERGPSAFNDLAQSLKRGFTEAVEESERGLSQYGGEGGRLEREVLFFFLTDLADRNQVNTFVNSTTYLAGELSALATVPISFGAWLALPRIMDAPSRMSVFYESLGRVSALLSQVRDASMLPRRLLGFQNTLSRFSGLEDASLLADCLCNDSVRMEVEHLDEAGRQLRPQGKESSFSVVKGVRPQYDAIKVNRYLRHQLVQKIVEEKLLHHGPLTEEKAGYWFEWYINHIERVTQQAVLDCKTGCEASLENTQNDQKGEFDKKKVKQPSTPPDSSSNLDALEQLTKDALEKYHREIDHHQSFEAGVMFLEFCLRLERGTVEDPEERQINIAKLRHRILNELIHNNPDLIGEFLTGACLPKLGQTLPGLWIDSFEETMAILQECLEVERPAEDSGEWDVRKACIPHQAELALGLLKAVSDWPVQPEIVRRARQEFERDINTVFETLAEQEAEIASSLDRLRSEGGVQNGKGLFWRIRHHAEVRRHEREMDEKEGIERTRLEDLKRQKSWLRENVLAPWSALGARWVFVLQGVFEASALLDTLYGKATQNTEVLQECLQASRRECAGIQWVDTISHQFDLVCERECQQLLQHAEMANGEFYAAWVDFPKGSPDYSGLSYANVSALSSFADGQMNALVKKLQDFASQRFSEYMALNLTDLLSITGEDKFSVLVRNALSWLEPWNVLDESLCRALGEKGPITEFIVGVSAPNREILERAISRQGGAVFYFDNGLKHEISLLSATCGIPAFVLNGILGYRKAWIDSQEVTDHNPVPCATDLLLPESMIIKG